jgi:hypothetical protein
MEIFIEKVFNSNWCLPTCKQAKVNNNPGSPSAYTPQFTVQIRTRLRNSTLAPGDGMV